MVVILPLLVVTFTLLLISPSVSPMVTLPRFVTMFTSPTGRKFTSSFVSIFVVPFTILTPSYEDPTDVLEAFNVKSLQLLNFKEPPLDSILILPETGHKIVTSELELFMLTLPLSSTFSPIVTFLLDTLMFKLFSLAPSSTVTFPEVFITNSSSVPLIPQTTTFDDLQFTVTRPFKYIGIFM